MTRGLLDTLNREELQGVIGHEMGHIVNWDIRYATAVGVLVGLIALVSVTVPCAPCAISGGRSRSSGSGGRGGGGAVLVVLFLLLFAALAPVFAKLVQMAVSRQREFLLADATSVRLTRHPEGLISALEKLATQCKPFKGANRATQHMFIVNPFRNFSEKATRLFSTRTRHSNCVCGGCATWRIIN